MKSDTDFVGGGGGGLFRGGRAGWIVLRGNRIRPGWLCSCACAICWWLHEEPARRAMRRSAFVRADDEEHAFRGLMTVLMAKKKRAILLLAWIS